MSSEMLMQRLQQLSPLSLESEAAFLAILKPISYPKNHIFLREGQISNYFFYLKKGAVRLFYYKNEKEITEWLTLDDSFFLSIGSFYRREPSRIMMQTLESCELILISHDDLLRLSAKYHDIETLHRKIVTASLLSSQVRMESIQFETAQQRYDKFIATRPDILQRVPLMHIASFLGVTLETLSRIRANK
jgi:CRP-like cAMP-binding protein